MAKATKNSYKPAKRMGNYKPVKMAEGGNVSELGYSERREYIEENYAPFITDAQMIFSIYDSGIEYDYKGDRKEVVNSIIESYKELGDYTETTLPQETIYEIQDWDLVRKEIDTETDEVIGETPLKELSADNTYNFSYNGLVDLNWKVYHDEDYDRFFYVITPHLGGDIRGNYGDAIILEGNDKDDLFYRFYEGFISGGASVYIKFKDGSEIGFDSEQDSDVFYFRVNEGFDITGMAQKYLNDFEKFESWQGDEFLEETIDIYLARKGVAPKMMAGGSLNDETPKAYIQILGYDEGKWLTITDYSDGQDVIDAIGDWMNDLNQKLGGNREEFEVADYEGFGDDLYDQYMSSNEFDEIIEAYEKYESSDFPADVISAYKKDSGSRNDSLSDVIDEMDNNYFGKYDNLNDFGYEMVEQGVYQPSENDVFITHTDKRILAGEESDSLVDEMSFENLMNVAPDTKSEYEDEKSELEDKILEIQSEIDDLTYLQTSADDDDEYETIASQIEEKEVELDDVQSDLDDIDNRFEDKAREEARESFYDEIHDRLENDLEGWLSDYGYDTDNLADVSFISVDYEKIGNELSSDYLIVEFDGEMYFFNNYAKGGRIMASKRKPKYDFYIVENSTKKLVSGYSSKAEAIEQRKLLIQQYPSMRFEIYPLANLEAKTDLDVYAKKDYVELSTLDKIKKVSVDAYRYGQDKVGQAQMFLEKNDVKGKIKRGARKVADKTKQGASWLQKQWREADFGDGKGKAKYFADGGNLYSHQIGKYVRAYYNETISNDDNGYQVNLMFYNNQDDDDYFDEEFITTNSPEEAEILADKINEEGVEKFMPKNKFADGGEIQVGNKFGDWSITQYKPIVYEDRGGTRDGLIKLVNQDTFDEILVQYDGALRNPKWFARSKGVMVEGKSPKQVIEKLKIADGGGVGEKIIGKTSTGKSIYQKYYSMPNLSYEELKEASEIQKKFAKKVKSEEEKQMAINYAIAFNRLANENKFVKGLGKYADGGYPTKLNIGSIIQGVGFTMLKGLEGGKFYKVVDKDSYSATFIESDENGKIKKNKKLVRHYLSDLDGGISTVEKGNENGFLVVKYADGGNVGDAKRYGTAIYEVIKNESYNPRYTILAKYDKGNTDEENFKDFLKGISDRKKNVASENWGLSMVLFNLKGFSKENLKKYLPNEKILDIYDKYEQGGKVNKFQVGDRVRIKYISDNSKHNNEVGTITFLRDYNYYPNGDESVIEKKTQGTITYKDGSEESVLDFYREESGVVSSVEKVKFADGGGVGNTARTYDGINALRSYQKNEIEDIQEYIADNGTIIEFVSMNDRDSSSGMTFAVTINGRGIYANRYREDAMEFYKDEIAKYKNNYKFADGGRIDSVKWVKTFEEDDMDKEYPFYVAQYKGFEITLQENYNSSWGIIIEKDGKVVKRIGEWTFFLKGAKDSAIDFVDEMKNKFDNGGGVGEILVGTFYYDTRKDKAFQIISEDGTDINGFKRKDGVVDIGIQYYDNNKQPIGKIEIIDKGGFEYYVQMGAYKKYQQPYFSDGGGVEYNVRGFKVGDYFYKTPSQIGKNRFYKITSIDKFYIKADDYTYEVNKDTHLMPNKVRQGYGGVSSWTRGDFEYKVDTNQISQYNQGDLSGYSDGGMAGLGEVSGMLPNPLPMSTITPMANGGRVQAEIINLDNRIHNLEELVVVVNEDEKAEMYATINTLKKEKENLIKKGNKTEEVKEKKSFFGLFAKGGEIKSPKDNSKVHFTDDQNREYDGRFIEDENMFFIGFEDRGGFRFKYEVIDWHYLDDKNDDDAHVKHEASETAEQEIAEHKSDDSHAKHEASETAEEEKAEHEYDVYDNKRMLENQAKEVEHHSEELNNQVEITERVPAWVIAKMERATTDLSDITHYLDGENKMANGGNVGEVKYEILPHINKFIVAKVTYKQQDDYTYPSKEFIYGFNDKFLEFNDMKSAQQFIDNIEPKYPYGIPKANVGMLLLASELLNKKQAQQPQQAQPQVVYYIPQPQPQEVQNTGIVQDIPEMANGGYLGNDDELKNDFCITNLIELANELQSVKYFVTDRFKENDIKSKNYKGRLIIVFKEPASVNVVNSINKFIERAEDCHHIFEQSVNVSGSEPNSLSINLLSDKFSDTEFNKGGKVYDYAPKKINLEKTKKITTHLGDYNLGLITNDFVYFVNLEEGDDNANTIMYNKKGELLSDNYFASNDLFEVLEKESTFEFIHPEVEYNRQEILKGN